MWCTKLIDNVFCVNYVGSAPVYPIFSRISYEYDHMEQYSLIKYDELKNGNDLSKIEIDIEINSFRKAENSNLVELNKNEPYIFYFPIDENFKIRYTEDTLNKFIRDMEGSLKLKLWMKGKTRRYLTSLESMRYNINPDNLEIRLKSDNISVIGINA